MIYKNKQELQARYKSKKTITYVYHAKKLVWQAISSCFGSGWWINAYEWKNSDAWKN